MRNWTRLLFVLLIAACSHLAVAQTVTLLNAPTGPAAGNGFFRATPNQRTIQPLPGSTGNARLAPQAGEQGPSHLPLMTSSCGPDTLMYPIAKASGFRILNFGDSVALGQWYDAPQAITIHGMSFYAWVDSLTNQTVTLIARVYNAGTDSLPIGAPLASASITIDSNFYNGTLSLLEKSVAFAAPVTVNGPYVVTVENNTAIACGFVSNSYIAGDGAGEWLGHIYLPGAPSAWYHGYDISLGGFLYDADNLIYPHVTYSLTASYTQTPLTGCAPLTAAFTNTSSPVLFSRFYNIAAAIGNPDSSFTWTYGNGSPSQNIVNGGSTYSTIGTFNVTLRDSVFAWRGANCADVGTGIVTTVNAPTAAFTSSSAGFNANFSDLSTGAPTSWAWNFGDGNTSTQQNPSHTYAVGGTFNVCLTVTSSCGTNTICQALTVGCPTLIAAFADSVQGLQYGVLDMSVGTPTSWLWDFGDGNTSTQQNFIHTYAVAGVYTVCLTVSDGCSTDSTCVTIVAGCPIPVADYNFITTGQSVAFTDQSTNLPATWAWDFGDGNTSTVQNPTHTYATVGTFNVCLIVGSTCGADTLCQTVVSGCNTPIANFNNTPTALTVAFSDASTGSPTAWQWTFGDGNNSTSQNPTHTYAAAGTYTVCLTVTSPCGTTTSCTSVTVTCPAPTAGFTSTTTGLTANFTNTSTGATSYSWAFGDGNTSTLQNPSHTYAQQGTYSVCLTVTGPCGTNTTCSTINFSCPTPNVNFSFTNINLNYSFTNLTTGNPTSYFWSFGDGGTSTAQNPTHLYANVGAYAVCLVAVNSCGADTFCTAVNVTCPTPNAAFAFTSNNLTVTFADQSTGNPTTWQWNFGDGSGNSIQTNPSYTYTAPGTYNVCLTAINSCGSDVQCFQVTVSCPPPSTSFSFVTTGNTTAFTAQAPGATTYAWNFGDGNTGTGANPNHVYGAVGTYNACLIASNICGADTFCQQVIVTCVPPTSNFNFVVSSDSVASFTNQSSPNSTAWLWNFGDGATSSAANPTHIYSAPGTYNVCLEVLNTCGRDTICRTVTITCINPTSGYTVQVVNAVATFTDLSLGAVDFDWDFGDGVTSNLQNPTHSYTQSGIYTVCLTVTNFCGTNTSCQNLVIACNDPVASFGYQNGASSVTFSDQSTNFPTQWFWNFGDGGTDTVQNPNHVFLFPGTYFVCMTVTNSCGSSFSCQNITVTAVGTTEADLLNQSFSVYPNPSEGRYTLQAELPKAMDIRVRVTNMLGQEIFSLPSERRVGTYSNEIDLTRLAAGTYHLELIAGETVLHRKLIKR